MHSLITITCRTAEQMRSALDDGINQCDIGSVAGVNSSETPMKVWDRKRRGAAPSDDSTIIQMEASLRPLIAHLFAQQSGAFIDPASATPTVKAMADKPWLRVRPDRMYWDASVPAPSRTERNSRLLECITVRTDFEATEMPSHMYCRLQYKMAVLGKEGCTVAWLNVVNGAFGITEVPFNEGFWKTLERHADTFWKECVLGGAAPGLIKTDEDVRLRFPHETPGKTVSADPEVMQAVLDYREALEAETRGKQRKENAAMRIRTAMGDAENLTDRYGQLLATWKCGKPAEELDMDRFRKEHPELYLAYTRPKPAPRSLRFKKPAALPA